MIYVIYPDILRYRSFVLNSKDARRKLGEETMFHFDPSPISYAKNWQPLNIEFEYLSHKKVDAMPDISLRMGRLFLNNKAYSVLKDLLMPCGEFLPVTYSGKHGCLFNVLSNADSVNGLDHKLCTKNEYDEVQSVGFYEDKVKEFPVFRTEYDDFNSLYCSEKFKGLVVQEKLNGIGFGVDLGNALPPDSIADSPSAH